MNAAELIITEATLLDEGNYRAWLELYLPDSVYWVPMSKGLDTPSSLENSYQLENRDELEVRVERMLAGLAHSEQPHTTMQHVLQAPREVQRAGGSVWQTPFFYGERHGNDITTMLGCYEHTLAAAGSEPALKIRRKKVVLLGMGTPLPLIRGIV